MVSSVGQSRARHEERAKFPPHSCCWDSIIQLGRKRDETRHNHRIQQQNTTEDAEKALRPSEATRSQAAASPGSLSLLVW